MNTNEEFNHDATYELVDKKTGRVMNVGDVVTTQNGIRVRVTGTQPPHRIGVQGKVSVQVLGAQPWSATYYVSVVGGYYREVTS